jgi:hypothetical protein
MLVRDVLLTLAGHEFFNPKWSARIRAEWMRNLSERLNEQAHHGDIQRRVERTAAAMDAAFPDAAADVEFLEPAILEPVQVKDRHVAATAMAVQADAIVTFNIADFAAEHLWEGWARTNIAMVEHQRRHCSHLKRGLRRSLNGFRW